MASRIRPLSDRVANQIAAGEVVERPASIVKELIENAIDAEAGNVTVSFRNGGKSYIEITDDGTGMERDDAILAFERHATSKIRDEEDLRRIATLGFRGEALASIASVSRLTLSTAVPEGSEGTEVTIEGGKMKNVRDCPPIKGSRVTVNTLFYNIPARRKFLRSENVEASHLQEAVIRQALGRPGLGFELIRNGKPVFDVKGQNGEDGYKHRITGLFGGAISAALTEVSYNYAGMRVKGFVSAPGAARANRDSQYVFINGRFVRDRLVSHAVSEGYRSLLPKGRHPAIFLWVDMPADRVDVNVSPTKTEVRFVDGGTVIELVKTGVLKALMGSGRAAGEQAGEVSFAPPAAVDHHFGSGRAAAFAETIVPIAPGTPQPVQTWQGGPVPQNHQGYAEGVLETAETIDISGEMTPGELITGEPNVVGQIFATFIVVEEGERLLLFDQHTVHERINFEKLTLKYEQGRVETQELLFPVQLDLSGRDAGFLKRGLDQFEKLGFYIDQFGENSFTLRAVPALLLGKDYEGVILDILDKVLSEEGEADFGHAAGDAINVISCRSAVKAGQVLDRQEMVSLIKQLNGLKLPYTCPHGRPISMAIDKEALLKGFFRK